jgi:hypothetical protein
MSSLNPALQSVNAECIGADRNDLFGRLSDQVDEKRRGLFRRSRRDLRINVFRDLFDVAWRGRCLSPRSPELRVGLLALSSHRNGFAFAPLVLVFAPLSFSRVDLQPSSGATRLGRQAIKRFAQENAEIAQFLSKRGCASGDDGALRMAVFYADGALTRPTLRWRHSANSQSPESRPISTRSRSPQTSAPNWWNSSLLTSPISIRSVFSC